MEIEKLKKTTIERLKKVKAEQGLSVSRIMEMLEAKGKFVSEATVKRIFSEGSEEFNFRYQDSIAPLADVLLDLYCGTGTIGLSMAKKVKKLIGVEIIPQAIENAKKNAALNGIDNAEFICADAAKATVKLEKQGIKPDVVILDPPRKGCDKSLIETVVKMTPDKVVYVSCDSATMARDISIFNELGYKPTEITPVDMFPATPHVETVALLSKLVSHCSTEVEFDLETMPPTKTETKAYYCVIIFTSR